MWTMGVQCTCSSWRGAGLQPKHGRQPKMAAPLSVANTRKQTRAAWRRAALATPVPCQSGNPQPSASMAVQQHGRATGKCEA